MCWESIHGFDFTSWANNLACESWEAVSLQLDGIITEETQPKKASEERTKKEEILSKLLELDSAAGLSPLVCALVHPSIPEVILIRMINHQP